MRSESLFTKCKNCGKDISKSAKACPTCGEKRKKLSTVHWIGLVFVGLILLGILNAPEDGPTTSSSNSSASATDEKDPEPQVPEDQATFVQTVSGSAEKFTGAKNELQESRLRDERKTAISSSLDGYSISSWVGTINQLDTNMEGNAILSVRIAPDIEITTWNNALSDLSSQTLIDKDDPLYETLLNLSIGQRVKVTGSFFPSDRDYIEETSITIEGSMRDPEFLFQFSSVTPIN